MGIDPRPLRTSVRDAPEHIAARRPFVAGNGTMRGTVVRSMPASTGRLAWSLEGPFRDDVSGAAQTFVVWSYGTPIAWTRPDGSLTVPPQHYTATTSRHQYAAR